MDADPYEEGAALLEDDDVGAVTVNAATRDRVDSMLSRLAFPRRGRAPAEGIFLGGPPGAPGVIRWISGIPPCRCAAVWDASPGR